jgi:hypothetical protein
LLWGGFSLAKKFFFKNLPAYQEGHFALIKSPDDGLWYNYHIQSQLKAMWIIAPFKQKRDALAFAKSLNDAEIDWDVNSDIQLLEKNDANHVHTIMSRISRAVRLGLDAD